MPVRDVGLFSARHLSYCLQRSTTASLAPETSPLALIFQAKEKAMLAVGWYLFSKGSETRLTTFM
jgi:hypothetical protein